MVQIYKDESTFNKVHITLESQREVDIIAGLLGSVDISDDNMSVKFTCSLYNILDSDINTDSTRYIAGNNTIHLLGKPNE